MNRTWWQHRQATTPTALASCTTRFAKKYPRDWRRRIQQTEELDRYFHEMYKYEVQLARVAGGARPYGYRVVGNGFKVARTREYTTAEEARWAALAMAFALVEADERRVPFVKPTVHQPVRRQPKDEKKNLPREDWRKTITA